jgi:hypothetical protein
LAPRQELTPTFRSHIVAEIASLQARSDQLAPTEFECDQQLLALANAVASARNERDAAQVERLTRKAGAIERRRAQVSSEIQMLRALIDARLTRYGMDAEPAGSPQAGTRPDR